MAHDNPQCSISLENIPSETNAEGNTGRKALNLINHHPPSDSAGSTQRTPCCRNLLASMACFKSKCPWIVNGFIVLFMLTFMMIVLEFNFLPFKTIGFLCKDPNLGHKYWGDTVKFQYLLAVTLTLPLFVIVVIESVKHFLDNTYVWVPWNKKSSWGKTWTFYGQYLFGMLAVLLFVQLGKSLIGGPRPDFFDTCKPDKAINCTSEYFLDYKCTNKNLSSWVLRDSSRSFPSGHAALSLYMAVFLCAFLHYRIPKNKYLIIPWLQCALLTWAAFCSLSRITDRRHHWWDVLAGALLGTMGAILTVKTQCGNFRSQSESLSSKPDKNLNETGNMNGACTMKLLGGTVNGQQQPPTDDRELREVK